MEISEASETKTALLEMRGITKTYGGIHALDRVSFDLQPGEVHALLGANGAGKSTLVKIIAGAVTCDAGEVRVQGQEIKLTSAKQARALGIAAVFQELSLLPELTVAENVFLGHERAEARFFLNRRRMHARTAELLEKYGIDLDPQNKVASLSLAQRQLVEIVKAVSLRPLILVMDEPTASLSQREAEIVFRIIIELKSRGCGIVYVSHKLDDVFRVAERMTIVRDGRRIGVYSAGQLEVAEIIRLMAGKDIREETARARGAAGRPVLELRGLTREPAFRDISLTVGEGEVLGIAGLMGSGRSALARAIFGADKVDRGEILVEGVPVSVRSIRDARELGIALVPEDRRVHGLVLGLSLQDNLILPSLDHWDFWHPITQKAVRSQVEKTARSVGLNTSVLTMTSGFLSGGNQQKAVIAKWILDRPKILIADEPTAGIDVHSKAEIYGIIEDLSSIGVPVVLIASDMTELVTHSDRIMVMNAGRSLGTFAKTTPQEILSLIMEDTARGRRETIE